MKKLFSFLSIKEVPKIIRILAKVERVIYIVFAIINFLVFFFATVSYISEGESAAGLFYFLVCTAGTLLILLIGIIVEAMLTGFGIIVKNNYEELKVKNIAIDNNLESPDYDL